MLNDENGHVRMLAVETITKISTIWPIPVTDGTMQSLMLILSDHDDLIRVAAYKMVGTLHFSTHIVLEKALDCIIPQLTDKTPLNLRQALMNCVGKLGQTHSDLMESHFLKLFLGLDPRFLAKENRLDDLKRINYIMIDCCHLVMIFNACKGQLEIQKMLPSYVKLQYPLILAQFEYAVPSDIFETDIGKTGMECELIYMSSEEIWDTIFLILSEYESCEGLNSETVIIVAKSRDLLTDICKVATDHNIDSVTLITNIFSILLLLFDVCCI